MLHEPFKEDPQEFAADIRSAYKDNRLGRVPGGCSTRSVLQMSLGNKLEILRALPPCDRSMFSLRSMCLPGQKFALKHAIQSIESSDNSPGSQELLLNAAGYIPDQEGGAQIDLVPREDKEQELLRRMHLVAQRTTRKGKPAEDRAQ